MTIALLPGCAMLVRRTPEAALSEARRYLEAGEFYRARKAAGAYLKHHPDDARAQDLMLEILDREMSRHREIFANRLPEELSAEEKMNEIETWLDRARTLLSLHEYDRAVEEAENVFALDPENRRASRLIDEIREASLRDGKQGLLSGYEVIETESRERLERYREQAREAFRDGKWGAAQVAAQKMLILAPDDAEANEMLRRIRTAKNGIR